MPYRHLFSAKQFILRDWLALDRTILANERTILSYTRTALTLILAGMSLIRFFHSDWWSALGYLALTGGIVLWLTGFHIYRVKKRDYTVYIEELQSATKERIAENSRQKSGGTCATTSLR